MAFRRTELELSRVVKFIIVTQKNYRFCVLRSSRYIPLRSSHHLSFSLTLSLSPSLALFHLPENTHRGGKITVQLVSSLSRQDPTKKKKMLLFVCSEAVESIHVNPYSYTSPNSECSQHLPRENTHSKGNK